MAPDFYQIKLDPFHVAFLFDFHPVKIVRNDRATIVFWKDRTKTVVKRSPDEPDNEYTAFTAALAKKALGSNSAIRKIIETKTEVQKPKDDKD